MINKGNFAIERYSVVTSTNDVLKEKAKNGAPEGTVVISNAQTAGRGRRGRAFASPADCGIYMSVLLRPGEEANAFRITAAAAAAVARVLEQHTGRETQIKWVNDIFQRGKKVCGILAESVFDPVSRGIAYILGIGINLKEPPGGYPEAVRGIAGAAFDAGETVEQDAIVADILALLFSEMPNCYSEYVKRDMLRNKAVTVLQNDLVAYTAKAVGIDKTFGLHLRLEDGSETVLRSGEVSVKIGNKQTEKR